MAIYEYMCKECSKITSESHDITQDVPKTKCRHCGKVADKIISSTTFLLRGKKWAAKGKEGY